MHRRALPPFARADPAASCKTLPNRFEDSPGAPLLIPGYDFITGYVTDSLVDETDGKISILMAIPTGTPVEGSAFKSRSGFDPLAV